MPIFELRKIEAIVGKQQFYELLIDNNSQYEDFTNEVKKTPQYYSELKTVLTYMTLVAELKMLPRGKFRDITPAKDKVKEYEFKSDHLRVYAFHLEKTGKIVAYWGYKNSQNEDIKKFRSLKQRFIKTTLKW